ncbi:glycine betaine ABC transporter substrate-binding protein [Corynebacterium casei]|uniref:ABC transporter substrate-binding protein n=3 Tax=Corynebacterium casei TaxID=160386 RepID=UPI001866B3FB|nr:ABC transporter substrate-binding protein [Corynebacterium casei]MDN5799841.1 ABC transporter substrate-binding protein [Corynebacterium casei]MDN6274379.1 ABC transporter substrate-binding protein [Corynebacterium casei]MDN6286471.1 ABC transporter substrate-binding protein [Corynebacterium casei]MDN6313404.1 ABC transporter substrate-binding protein [Corynebacterium casei]MDN6341872.1 ABC transporter substrate-binding protein [Corynebacterium casei]
MFRKNRVTAVAALALTSIFALTACGTDSSPLEEDTATNGGGDETIVIGSQDYYSNEIIAEIYAQALENAGYDVDRQFRIGQREAYLPEIESGEIDLFPEYSGPVLQYWEPDTEARLPDDVFAALEEAAPEGLNVLEQSPATDQDSYVITQEFAEEWGIENVEDLSKVTEPMTLGANSEAEDRPNGPKGLEETYGVEVGFAPIEDSGGPLTVKALRDGDVQLAIIYTADPSIESNNLVSLEDTKGLFLSSNVVPLASDKVDEQATEIINEISAAMSPEDLVSLNNRSVTEQLPAADIAQDWLEERGLL